MIIEAKKPEPCARFGRIYFDPPSRWERGWGEGS